MPLVLLLVRRDLGGRVRGGLMLPFVFFLLVATLVPFSLGPDARLLARVAGGIMWSAALLAALLPVERLVAPDREDGTLDQYLVRGVALETYAVTRMLSHWLAFAPLLLFAAIVGAALLQLPPDELGPLLGGLLLGTPALATLGVVAAALTASLRGAGALAGLIVLPLALPILIFGAGMLAPSAGAEAAAKLLAAASLLTVAVGPFAAGAALRATSE